MIYKAQYDKIKDKLWLKYDIYNDWKNWDLESLRNILFELQ